MSGKIIGKHDGIINFTIGQRKGIGVAYKEPLYVVAIDAQKNQVIFSLLENLSLSQNPSVSVIITGIPIDID